MVFRDGVGDGRLNHTLEYEVPQIQQAFKRFGDGYNPKLSFVVVSKRVLSRFAIANTRVNAFLPFTATNYGSKLLRSFVIQGEYDNVPVGTVVDHTINKVYADGWPNFYLVSQSTLRGTVSPTHYILLYDNSDIHPDHLQKLTYKLTFMYVNSPAGSISVPAPCMVSLN